MGEEEADIDVVCVAPSVVLPYDEKKVRHLLSFFCGLHVSPCFTASHDV